MSEEEAEGIRYISITDVRARKLEAFKTQGRIPSRNWAVKMGIAIGILMGKKAGGHFVRGHGVDVESVDKQGLFRLLEGTDIAQYGRGGLDVLIKELDEGNHIYDIYKKYFPS